MVVCHCLRINDQLIARIAEDPTITTDDVTAECGAGGRCGGCRPSIDAIIAQGRSGELNAASGPVAATMNTPVAVPRRVA